MFPVAVIEVAVSSSIVEEPSTVSEPVIVPLPLIESEPVNE